MNLTFRFFGHGYEISNNIGNLIYHKHNSNYYHIEGLFEDKLRPYISKLMTCYYLGFKDTRYRT